jgi:hypothetical protein
VATYRLSLSVISRSDGRTVQRAAAYRSGEKWTDRHGQTHDYTKRRGVVARHLVGWQGTRAELWDLADASERRANSRTAREITLSLPHELPERERVALAVRFGEYLRSRFDRVACDVCVHRPSGRRGSDPRGHHCHILFTTRAVTEAGEMGAKTRELDDLHTGGAAVEEMRAEWAAAVNTALLRAGVDARVDNRSYQRQGVARESQHLSRGARELERRGEQTDRGDEVRARRRRNHWRQRRDEVRAPVALPTPLREAREVEPSAVSSHLSSDERAALLDALRANRDGAAVERPERPRAQRRRRAR